MKKLGFGCMRLPVLGSDNSNIDVERFKEMVDLFQSRGFTYYDTAYNYHGGKSECALREALVERYPRNAFTITTKMPMFRVEKAEDFKRIFFEQLQRLGVEYVDYYWLHAINKKEYEKAQQLNAFGFISQMKAEGKIKHIGFSFHDSPELLDRILTEHPETEFVQLQINYIDWDSPAICGRQCYETAVKHGKPIIIMEPVKGGALANVPKPVEELFKKADPDASVASWAVRYAASLPNVLTVLSGMSNIEQVDDNTSYMRDFKPLGKDGFALVETAAETIKNYTAIPCTACRYCVDGCPQKISIPDYFGLYNEYMRMKRHLDGDYKNVQGGKPGQCVLCGRCENVCPQHLKIRSYLKDVAAIFEK